jgi:hypothetical protein
VLCPVCGGLIHPIAGRCKHCKTDLSAFRAQRPQAAAQLPALAQRAEPPPPHPQAQAVIPPSAPEAFNGNGHSAPTSQAPSPWAPPSAHHAFQAENPQPVSPAQLAQEAAQQAILPPRPSGMSWTHMQRQAPPRSAWRSWPMVVIILAMIAIVTAVVIMVWPTSSRADVDKKGALEPPPAPERMDMKPTTPTPPPPKAPTADDPWGPSGQITPGKIDPLDPTAPSGGANSDAMAKVAMRHLCDRMSQCSNVGSLQSLCNAMPNAAPPSCAAAQRCLEHIDTISCSTSTDDDAFQVLTTVMTKVPDCMDALRC